MPSMRAFAEEFLAALERRSRTAAIDVVTAARDDGAGVGEVIAGVLAPAQRQVGSRWQRNEWSVVQEHGATVITDLALSAIAVDGDGPVRGHLVAACPEREWHALPLGMIVEALRELDWDVTFLGASVPAGQLEGFLREHRPDALLVGVSMVGRLPAASACVDAARRSGVPAVLGGAAVRSYPAAAHVVGAWSCGEDVRDVDDLLGEVVGGDPRPRPPREGPQAICDELVRIRTDLCEEVLEQLDVSSPSWSGPEGQELLRSCVGEVVDALAAGALLADGGPVRDIVRWEEDLLSARDVGAGVVGDVLGTLSSVVEERVPGALANLREAVELPSAPPPDEPEPEWSAPLGLLTVTADPDTGSGRVVHASRALAGLTHRPREALAGMDVAEVLGPKAWTELRTGLGDESGRAATVLVDAKGRHHPVVLHWTAAPDQPGCPGDAVVVGVEEVGGRRRFVRSLRRKALHDPLTGLPNRVLFLEHLEQALRDAQRTGRAVAVVYVDVDDLKEVNESLGHEAGDELLVSVAHRLRRALRVSDVAGRLGGDEFAVVCPGLSDDLEVGFIGERIQATVSGPCVVAGREVPLAVSVGLATGRSAEEDGSAVLLHRADEALRRAKQGGKNAVVLFDAALDRELRQRQRVVGELRQATRLGQFELRYQPVVDLADGHVVGAEALVRWQHPRRGLLAPADFLHLAEDSGSILDLGPWILSEACDQVARWARPAGVSLVLSVNVSARQLGRGEVVERLAAWVESGHVDPRRLRVEVTETVLTDSAAARAELWEIDRIGVPIGIDDFGTGYASLSYLRQLPVHFLKIDRSFVAEMMRDRTHHAIVASVTDLASALGITVIAEGVETAEQAQALLDLGCRTGQGFLYSAAVTAEEFVELVTADGSPAGR
jgi:diguanylate cyclase (GGDEF)-like protein